MLKNLGTYLYNKYNTNLNNFIDFINYLFDKRVIAENNIRIFVDYLEDKQDKKEAFLQICKNYYDIPYVNTALAELNISQKYLDNGIKYFQHIIEKENSKNFNYHCRIFDCYLAKFEFDKAEQVLSQIITEGDVNKQFINKKSQRMFLLSSGKAKKYFFSIKQINDISSLKIQDPKMFINAYNLTHYNIEFIFNKWDERYDLAFEYNKQYYHDSMIKIIEIKNYNQSCIVPFNLLNIDKFGILDKQTKNFIPLYQIVLKPTLQVLDGENGWLFLDNDSNNSVSQYKGEYLINEANLLQWNKYLSQFNKLENALLLIAPNKESVYSCYYPYKKGRITSIDQVLCLCNSNKANVFYPLSVLRNTALSYSKIETHWSYLGAFETFKEILKIFNLDFENHVFPFSFEEKELTGDLGSKFSPVKKGGYLYLSKFGEKNISPLNFVDCVNQCVDSNAINLVFSNCFIGQGSIRIFENSLPLLDKKIVLFGDSFLEQLVPYFMYTFSRVVYVRSNATMIRSIIEHEKPDYIFSEIVERMIIRAPIYLNEINSYAPFYKLNHSKNIISLIDNELKKDGDNFYFGYLRSLREKIKG